MNSTRPSAAAPLRKIHLVSKTHLDIGFTDPVDIVMDLYLNRYLPRAIELNDRLTELGRPERFIWTTGSWIIHEALQRADQRRRALLERGIAEGSLTWHAMPFTPHTEFLTRDLVAAGLALSGTLDKEFGRTTISAKLTDVPGHTRSLIPQLYDAGVELLHVGINGGIATPDVPPLFRWKDPATETEITVAYDGDYGDFSFPAGSDVALDMWVTADNDGPPTFLRVVDRFKRLEQAHPGALIAASTLDDYARDIRPLVPGLRYLTSEIGDNWIYGTGSDPQKVSEFRALARLHSRWAASPQVEPDVERFAQKLMLVGEHTWGLDTIVHLPTPDYSPAGFARQRSEGVYAAFEKSWSDQRDYLSAAVAELGEQRREEATRLLEDIRDSRSVGSPIADEVLVPGSPARIVQGEAVMEVNASTGELISCSLGQTVLVAPGRPIGSLTYQQYGSQAYENYRAHYVKATHRTEWWVDKAFGKFGLDDGRTIQEFRPVATRVTTDAGESYVRIEASLEFPEGAHAGFESGLTVSYELDIRNGGLRVELRWPSKTATVVPEALWLGFSSLSVSSTVSVHKLGQYVSAHDAVIGGARNLHAIEDGIVFHEPSVDLAIRSLDTALVSIGDNRLLTDSSQFAGPGSTAHFNLFNNLWGTNFPLWIEGAMSYTFEIEMNPKPE